MWHYYAIQFLQQKKLIQPWWLSGIMSSKVQVAARNILTVDRIPLEAWYHGR